MFKQSRIGRRLIVSIVLFSTLLTLLITSVQLYRDYRMDLNRIETQLQQIEDVYLRSLSALLWASDTDEIRVLAEGIMRLRDMQYVEVRDASRQWAVVGVEKEQDVIRRLYPVIYHYRGEDRNIGTLTVTASLDGVYDNLYDKVVTILISNGIKTFLVAVFIYFIFHYLVNRHIVRIADYTRRLDIGSSDQLELDRRHVGEDELDDLVDAYNTTKSRLRTSVRKLHESNERYRSLVEYSNAIPWEMDLQTYRFTFVGKQAEAKLGYPVQEWYRENFWVDHVHEDDRVAAVEYCNRQTRHGRDHTFEYRMYAADGRLVWIEDDVIVIKEDGIPVRLQGFMFDITEQKRARQSLQLANDLLEEKVAERTRALELAKDDAERANQLKTEFLGRISHELRTPMNAILGFGQLLQGGQLTKDQADSVNEIVKAGNHLLYLIDDVLDLSAIENGKVHLQAEDFEFGTWLNECLALVESMAGQRDITINVEHSACEGQFIRMDRERMKEVMLNLLTNAVKYNVDGGTIGIACERQSVTTLRILVRDSGPGLTQQQQSVMFEPFNRLGAEFSDTRGTGIGLSIARRLLDLMGGAMGVISAPGKGSTFWVDCRLSPSVVRVENKSSTAAQPIRKGVSEHGHILCIEDNEANLHLVEKIVTRMAKYSLDVAVDAETGLQQLRRQRPDVILMDINLPGIDGFEALARLRADNDTCDIPVIAISAAAAQQDIDKGLQAGFHAYLTKPINIAEVEEVLTGLLSKESGPDLQQASAPPAPPGRGVRN